MLGGEISGRGHRIPCADVVSGEAVRNVGSCTHPTGSTDCTHRDGDRISRHLLMSRRSRAQRRALTLVVIGVGWWGGAACSSTDDNHTLRTVEIEVRAVDHDRAATRVSAAVRGVGESEDLLPNWVAVIPAHETTRVDEYPWLGCLRVGDDGLAVPLSRHYRVTTPVAQMVDCGGASIRVKPNSKSDLGLVLNDLPAGSYRIAIAGFASDAFEL